MYIIPDNAVYKPYIYAGKTIAPDETWEIIDEDNPGAIELVIISCQDSALQIFMEVDIFPDRITVQEIIDDGLDDQIPRLFYVTRANPTTTPPKFIIVYVGNQQRYDKRFRLILENPTGGMGHNIVVNYVRLNRWEIPEVSSTSVT